MSAAPALFDTAEAHDALEAACRRYHVRRLDVFGSAATGVGFDPGRSDLDVLVEFEKLTPESYADAWLASAQRWKSFQADRSIL